MKMIEKPADSRQHGEAATIDTTRTLERLLTAPKKLRLPKVTTSELNHDGGAQ